MSKVTEAMVEAASAEPRSVVDMLREALSMRFISCNQGALHIERNESIVKMSVEAAQALLDSAARVPDAGADHWQYFNYNNVRREAKARLVEARGHPAKLTPEKDTLEYWCAWAAHANAASVLASAPSAGRIPEGWQLVPKEPTSDMARRFMSRYLSDSFRLAWAAALAAAPPPPQS